jgi:KEOPS complex subunit Cgi121
MMVEIPENLKIVGLRGKVDSSDEFLKKAKKSFGEKKALVQFFNADMILGKEHIESAIEHARRAFRTNKNVSQSMAMEILIYVSGEPQIASAIKKVGITDNCKRIAMVVDDKIEIEVLLKDLNMELDDEVLKFTEEKALAFGIKEEEIFAVEKGKRRDLVLERVAMVDVRK